MGSYRKIDDFTVVISTKEPASYFRYMALYILFTSPGSFGKVGSDSGRASRRRCRLPVPGHFFCLTENSRRGNLVTAHHRVDDPGFVAH
jgi:hypothetical protein